MARGKIKANPELTKRGKNARNMANRWIHNFEQDLKTQGLTKKQRGILRENIDRLEIYREQTYAYNTEKERRQGIAGIRQIAEGGHISKGKHGLSNYFTQQQINLAQKKVLDENGNMVYARVSQFSPEQTQVFYNATQPLWEGKSRTGYDQGITDTSAINKNIIRGMQELGVKLNGKRIETLQDAWDYVFSVAENVKAAQVAELANRRREQGNLTLEQIELLNALLDDAAYDGKYSDMPIQQIVGTTDTEKLD